VEGAVAAGGRAAWPAVSSAAAHRRGPLPPRGQPRTRPLAAPAVRYPRRSRLQELTGRSSRAGQSCRRGSSQSRALRPAAFASLRCAPGRPLTASFPGKEPAPVGRMGETRDGWGTPFFARGAQCRHVPHGSGPDRCLYRGHRHGGLYERPKLTRHGRMEPTRAAGPSSRAGHAVAAKAPSQGRCGLRPSRPSASLRADS